VSVSTSSLGAIFKSFYFIKLFYLIILILQSNILAVVVIVIAIFYPAEDIGIWQGVWKVNIVSNDTHCDINWNKLDLRASIWSVHTKFGFSIFEILSFIRTGRQPDVHGYIDCWCWSRYIYFMGSATTPSACYIL